MCILLLVLSPKLQIHPFNCLLGYLICTLNSPCPSLTLHFCCMPALPTDFPISGVNSVLQVHRSKTSDPSLSPLLLIHPTSCQKSPQLCIQNISRIHILLFSPLLPFSSFLFPFWAVGRRFGRARWIPGQRGGREWGVSNTMRGVSTPEYHRGMSEPEQDEEGVYMCSLSEHPSRENRLAG